MAVPPSHDLLFWESTSYGIPNVQTERSGLPGSLAAMARRNGPLGGDASLVTLIHMSIISVPMLGFHMAPDEVRHESILLSGPPLLNG